MSENLQDLLSINASKLKPSTIAEIHRLLEAPGMRSLAGAWPDSAVFQTEVISGFITGLLAGKGKEILQYGSTKGYSALREALSEQMAQDEGFRCLPGQILITSGSAQGLDLACRTFINPGEIVMVGLPSYFGATGTISSHGARMVGIPVDHEGIRVELMQEKLEQLKQSGTPVKAVYVIPNFQNPSGTTLSLQRRKRLIELAALYNFVIFEDDPYGELRFDGESIPALVVLDKAERVVHFRSASKTFSPGMRIAWVIGGSGVIDRMEIVKQCSDISTNSLSQYVLLELIRSGSYRKGIESSREHYRRKRDLALELIEKHFPPEVSWTKPSGGFFIFVTLPEQLNSNDLLREALKNNIAFISGPAFFFDGSGANTLRLSYSQAGDEDIRSAIPELAKLIEQQLAGSR